MLNIAHLKRIYHLIYRSFFIVIIITVIHRSRSFSNCGLHPFQRCFTTQEMGVLPPPKCQARAKRRRNLLLRDKLRILELLGRGETRDNVASEYDISLTTICVIKRDEDKIRSFVSSVNNDACLNRKNVRLPKDARHDQAVIQWLQIETSKGVEVSGAMITTHARLIYHQLHHADAGFDPDRFRATNGWLNRFRERQDLKQ